jgi:hypothetical protein
MSVVVPEAQEVEEVHILCVAKRYTCSPLRWRRETHNTGDRRTPSHGGGRGRSSVAGRQLPSSRHTIAYYSFVWGVFVVVLLGHSSEFRK